MSTFSAFLSSARSLSVAFLLACAAGLPVSASPLRAQPAVTPSADYYVATNGNDSWPGTLAQPFATVDHARLAVQSAKLRITTRPIVVMIRGGIYYLPSTWSFTSKDSGSATARIVYENYPGETPIISGGRRLSTWTVNGDGSWTSVLPAGTYFTQLWINDVRRVRPRTSGLGYLKIQGPYSSTGSTTVMNGLYYQTPPAGGVPASMANLNDVELVDFEYWDIPRFRLSSVNTSTRLITVNTSITQDVFHGFLPGHRFLLENVKESLKSPGQWYLDRPSSRLTYLPYNGETPATSTVIAPRLSKILYASGLSHVTFQGLTFSHNDWQIGAQGYGSGQAGENTGAAMTLTNSTDVVFEADTIKHTGDYGIEFLGAGGSTPLPYRAQFRDGLVADTGSGGIRIGGPAVCSGTYVHTDANVPQQVYLGNNLITGGGRIAPEGMAIMVGDAHHVLVEHNEIYDFYGSGVGVGFNWDYACNFAHDDIVQFNHIHDLGEGITSDIGAVYFLTGLNAGNKILNNKVHDISQDPQGYGGWGLYVDEGASSVLVANNLVYRASSTSLHMNQSPTPLPAGVPVPKPNTFTNNILAYGREGAFDRHNDSSFLSMVFQHNIVYYDKAQIQFGYWYCQGQPTCANYFQFNNNVYYNTAAPGGQPTLPFVSTPHTWPNTGSQPPITFISFNQWLSRGEDSQTMFTDPLFVNPASGVDNYTLKANSPALGVGFVPFDTTLSGRLPTATLAAPLIAPGFPLQPVPLSQF